MSTATRNYLPAVSRWNALWLCNGCDFCSAPDCLWLCTNILFAEGTSLLPGPHDSDAPANLSPPTKVSCSCFSLLLFVVECPISLPSSSSITTFPPLFPSSPFPIQ